MSNLLFCNICGKENNNCIQRTYFGKSHICDNCYMKTKIRCKDCKKIKSLYECTPLGYVCKGCELFGTCNAKYWYLTKTNGIYDTDIDILDKQNIHPYMDIQEEQLFDIHLYDNTITIAERNPCDYVEETYEYNKDLELYMRTKEKVFVKPDNNGTSKCTFYEFIKIIDIMDNDFNVINML